MTNVLNFFNCLDFFNFTKLKKAKLEYVIYAT